MEKVRSEKKGENLKQKLNRRQSRKNPLQVKYHNNGKPYNSGYPIGIGNTAITAGELQTITKRHKFKGWQREERRTHKSHKSAA